MPLTPDDESLLAELPADSRAAKRIRELAARASKAEEAIAGHGAAIEEARKEAARAGRAALDTERALYQAGITDPEGVDVALHLYGRLPTADRPEIGAWAGTAKGLSAYRPQQPGVPAPSSPAASPAAAAPAAPPPVAAPALPSPGGAAPAPSSGGMTAARIAEISAGGTWAAQKASVFAQLDGGRK